MQLVQEVQTMMEDEGKVHPYHFKGRIIFMSMYNDIGGTRRETEKNADQTRYVCPNTPRNFL